MEGLRKSMANGDSDVTPQPQTEVKSAPNAINRSRSRAWAYTLSGSIALLGLVILSVEMLLNSNVDPIVAEIRDRQSFHLSRWREDLQYLQKIEAFRDLSPTKLEATQARKDAGSEINALLYWTPRDQSAGFGVDKPHVSPGTREFLLRYQTEWIKARSFFALGKLKADLQIFEKLRSYDYWNIEQNSPLSQLKAQSKFLAPSQLPLPDAMELISLSKVRLIKGSVDKQPLAALRDVRQLAQLLLTTENFNLVTAGLAILDLERRAFRDYVDRGSIDEAAWNPIDQNTSQRAQRALVGNLGYLRSGTDPALLAEFEANLKSDRPWPGVCAAINEQFPVELALEDELGGEWPWERSFAEGFRAMHRIAKLAEERCRLELFREQRKRGDFRSADADSPLFFSYLPYFRTVASLRDWSKLPRRFDGYERIKRGNP